MDNKTSRHTDTDFSAPVDPLPAPIVQAEVFRGCLVTDLPTPRPPVRTEWEHTLCGNGASSSPKPASLPTLTTSTLSTSSTLLPMANNAGFLSSAPQHSSADVGSLQRIQHALPSTQFPSSPMPGCPGQLSSLRLTPSPSPNPTLLPDGFNAASGSLQSPASGPILPVFTAPLGISEDPVEQARRDFLNHSVSEAAFYQSHECKGWGDAQQNAYERCRRLLDDLVTSADRDVAYRMKLHRNNLHSEGPKLIAALTGVRSLQKELMNTLNNHLELSAFTPSASFLEESETQFLENLKRKGCQILLCIFLPGDFKSNSALNLLNSLQLSSEASGDTSNPSAMAPPHLQHNNISHSPIPNTSDQAAGSSHSRHHASQGLIYQPTISSSPAFLDRSGQGASPNPLSCGWSDSASLSASSTLNPPFSHAQWGSSQSPSPAPGSGLDVSNPMGGSLRPVSMPTGGAPPQPAAASSLSAMPTNWPGQRVYVYPETNLASRRRARSAALDANSSQSASDDPRCQHPSSHFQPMTFHHPNLATHGQFPFPPRLSGRSAHCNVEMKKKDDSVGWERKKELSLSETSEKLDFRCGTTPVGLVMLTVWDSQSIRRYICPARGRNEPESLDLRNFQYLPECKGEDDWKRKSPSELLSTRDSMKTIISEFLIPEQKVHSTHGPKASFLQKSIVCEVSVLSTQSPHNWIGDGDGLGGTLVLSTDSDDGEEKPPKRTKLISAPEDNLSSNLLAVQPTQPPSADSTTADRSPPTPYFYGAMFSAVFLLSAIVAVSLASAIARAPTGAAALAVVLVIDALARVYMWRDRKSGGQETGSQSTESASTVVPTLTLTPTPMPRTNEPDSVTPSKATAPSIATASPSPPEPNPQASSPPMSREQLVDTPAAALSRPPQPAPPSTISAARSTSASPVTSPPAGPRDGSAPAPTNLQQAPSAPAATAEVETSPLPSTSPTCSEPPPSPVSKAPESAAPATVTLGAPEHGANPPLDFESPVPVEPYRALPCEKSQYKAGPSLTASTADLSSNALHTLSPTEAVERLKLEEWTAEKACERKDELPIKGEDGVTVVMYNPENGFKCKAKFSKSITKVYVEFLTDLANTEEISTQSLSPAVFAVTLARIKKATLPLGFIRISSFTEPGLVYNYIEEHYDFSTGTPRPFNSRDYLDVENQLKVIHCLGYCHMDVAHRNIIRHLVGEGASLIDFDQVCPIGVVPLHHTSADLPRPKSGTLPPALPDHDFYLLKKMQEKTASPGVEIEEVPRNDALNCSAAGSSDEGLSQAAVRVPEDRDRRTPATSTSYVVVVRTDALNSAAGSSEEGEQAC